MNSPPSSPPRRKQTQETFPGFRTAPRPNQHPPVTEMTIRELQDRHTLNAKLIASPGASTSTYIQRVLAEQSAIESRLVSLEGVEAIGMGLRRTTLLGDGDMQVDQTPEPPTSRMLEAKRKALGNFAARHHETNRKGGVCTIDFDEGIRLEQEAHRLDKERQERAEAKRRRLGMPIQGEVLTRQEREARMWAFMNAKPSESDMEESDYDDDDDDDDPATWFDDDQDDGRKGQNIVDPDFEDIHDIIRIDDSKLRYSSYYQQNDDGD